MQTGCELLKEQNAKERDEFLARELVDLEAFGY